jgi:hypothetical protein
MHLTLILVLISLLLFPLQAKRQKFIDHEKIFKILPLISPQCEGKIKLITFIEDHKVIEKVLHHLKLTFVAERLLQYQFTQLHLKMASGERGAYFLKNPGSLIVDLGYRLCPIEDRLGVFLVFSLFSDT